MSSFSERDYKTAYKLLGGEERHLQPGAGILFCRCNDDSNSVYKSLHCKECDELQAPRPDCTIPVVIPSRLIVQLSEGEKVKWRLHRDINWTEAPRKMVYDRAARARVSKMIVSDVLIKLAPDVIVNPRNVWRSMKADVPEQITDRTLSKKEEMAIENTRRLAAEKVALEIASIRSWTVSK